MLDRTDDISVAAESWLAQFEGALASASELQALFHGESYWRDVLALSWNIQTINGADAIVRELQARGPSATPTNFQIDPARAAPRQVTRAGTPSIEARLKQLQVDTLIVDRGLRIGDNWRKRYHALTLHNQVQVNHLPYMLFPPNWPTYIPKDKLANWFEAYVEAMELNYWTATEFKGGSYDENKGRWTVMLRRAGVTRTMHPRHVGPATGVSGIPNLPEIAGLKDFAGKVVHSSQYDDGENWKGKRAIVIGTGNSGHDIAQDLYSSGAEVTIVQRSPTLIVSIAPSAQLVYSPYNEGTLDDNDLIATSMPLPLARKSHAMVTEQSKQLDKELLEGLARVGFKLDFGEGNTGWQFKYLTRGGGYYFNVGCSDLIVKGEISLRQFADIETFAAAGAKMKSGETIQADLIVLA